MSRSKQPPSNWSELTEHRQSSLKWQKGWRNQLARVFQPTRVSVQPLLKEWLLRSQKGNLIPLEVLRAHIADSSGIGDAELQLLREAYLPETILAYILTLQFGGTSLTRDFLMECMDLCTHVASEGSDLLELFVKTGRLQDVVEAFAQASKALLVVTSSRQGAGSRSKKMKVRGWTQELWTVKP